MSGNRDRFAGLDAVEQGFGDGGALDVVAGDLGDGLVHGEVVLAGSDDEVDFPQQAVAVHSVVVEERAARKASSEGATGRSLYRRRAAK